ncbi:hypothetical protein COV15_02440 [Candidatus Woesearchaeota archaeon CG10_big_fil_rev_8_21_14_0_10_34_12]|nr:MAG: hypothetical protein COV15_02440 [Candidatus Woesearchaeota archaeon CG10_big_fil_rev_8_21_14_0_10_34_12]
MKQEYKIGNLKLRNRVFLAPMAEMNDIAFRLLCKNAGCGLTYTGMINPRTEQKLILDDKPAIQLFCVNDVGVEKFIKKYDKKASLFDFNLGCPSKVARRIGFGAFMNHRFDDIEKILIAMRRATKKPITIKLRKTKNVWKILKIAEKYCDAVCIHPRTIQQGYSGLPDVEFALRLKKKIKIPVIYSGNVNEKNSEELLKKFDFVITGRAALGNPGIFAKLTGKKTNFDFSGYLKLALKYKLYFSQIKLQAMNFTKAKNNAAELREKLVKCKTLNEIKKVMSV